MYHSKKWTYFLILFLNFNMLLSCQPRNLIQESLEFDRAMRQLVRNLLDQLKDRRFLQDILEEPATVTFVFNPFVAVDSGQVTRQSLTIEKLVSQEVHSYSKRFKVARITQDALQKADYLINGIIEYEAQSTAQPEKYHHVSVAVIDLKAKVVAARNEIWVDVENLDYTPTPIYQDNPLFLTKNRMLQLLIEVVKSPVGTPVGENYATSLDTQSLLVEAQTAYNSGDYKQAQQLFSNITQRTDGNTLETYGGLYATHFKLGLLAEAEKDFAMIVSLGAKLGSLPIKLMFESDSTEFLQIAKLRQQYDLWIKQIALYLHDNPQKCIDIVGHTSRAGLYDYNILLSKQRAETIQGKMKPIFAKISQRSQVIGRGPDETIVGTVPDNAQNAIDRRVEFKVLDCRMSSSQSNSMTATLEKNLQVIVESCF